MTQRPKNDRIDPLILPVVTILNENGYKTSASCQGGEGHSWPLPGIHVIDTFTEKEYGEHHPRNVIRWIARRLQDNNYYGFTIGWEAAFQNGIDEPAFRYFHIQFFDQETLTDEPQQG